MIDTTLRQCKGFCNKEWTTTRGFITFLHSCYLDVGHEGKCVCGECYESGEAHLAKVKITRTFIVSDVKEYRIEAVDGITALDKLEEIRNDPKAVYREYDDIRQAE